MKKFLLFIILANLGFCGIGQSLETPVQLLAVEKLNNTRTVTLVFKPDRKLKITTSDGTILTARDYLLIDGALLINQEETIQFDQIKSIKGKVYGNYERKILGLFMAVGSVPTGFVTVYLLAWSGWPVLPTALPFIGAIVVGIRLMGARRFNTGEKWELLIVEKDSSGNIIY